MMKALFSAEGSSFSVDILAEPGVREFIDAHAGVLDSSFERTPMSEAMRRRLRRSDWVFSGMKAFHELNEAFPSMLDENGDKKPFERFLNDVRKIDRTYNGSYLRAEYNFISASAEMAAKWEGFGQDGDRYNLQYRTQNDEKVRPEHAPLEGVTLPPSDPFWEEFYPPNGWNCRCTVVQVRKSKHPATGHDEAMALGGQALRKDRKGMFRFNPGREQSTVPAYNPYTISKCRGCDIPKGRESLARDVPPDNQVCAACRFLRQCAVSSDCEFDSEFGKRLKISKMADASELEENLRAAKALLRAFPDMEIKIREHVLIENQPNPEYLINSLVADRKGIEGHNGTASGFNKAKKQGCRAVVLDLDMHPEKFKTIPTIKLASAINNRRVDFMNGDIEECYVVFNDNAVRIESSVVSDNSKETRARIEAILEKINGSRSPH